MMRSRKDARSAPSVDLPGPVPIVPIPSQLISNSGCAKFVAGVKCIQVATTNGTLMTTPSARAEQLALVARLKSSYPELPDAPTPDLVDHERFRAYTKTPHDVGGEPDAPIEFENKQYEMWEEDTYVMCEVLD